MADVEYGRCDICGKNGVLARKYYRYPFPCECCGNEHFELICYCEDCVPHPPEIIKVKLKHEIATKLKLEEVQ